MKALDGHPQSTQKAAKEECFPSMFLELSCLCFVEYMLTCDKRERVEIVTLSLAHAEKMLVFLYGCDGSELLGAPKALDPRQSLIDPTTGGQLLQVASSVRGEQIERVCWDFRVKVRMALVGWTMPSSFPSCDPATRCGRTFWSGGCEGSLRSAAKEIQAWR